MAILVSTAVISVSMSPCSSSKVSCSAAVTSSRKSNCSLKRSHSFLVSSTHLFQSSVTISISSFVIAGYRTWTCSGLMSMSGKAFAILSHFSRPITAVLRTLIFDSVSSFTASPSWFSEAFLPMPVNSVVMLFGSG